VWLTIITIINPKIQWFKNTQFLIHEKKKSRAIRLSPKLGDSSAELSTFERAQVSVKGVTDGRQE
jgi:hypothetical protein